MAKIRLIQPKVIVGSGSAGDFPSASGFFNVDDVDCLSVMITPAGAVARTVTLTFADSAGNTLFTVSKALAATAVTKFLNIGMLPGTNPSAATDMIPAAADALALAICMPPKVRVSLASAATATDVVIVGRDVSGG